MLSRPTRNGVEIDDRSIEHILGAVGERFVPAAIDRPALRKAIEKAWTTQTRIIAKYRPGPGARALSNGLARYRKATDVYLSLLTADNDAAEKIREIVPDAAWNVSQVGSAIDRIKRVFDESVKETRANYPRRVPTGAEWLAGVELPCIYEEFFDREAAVSRNVKTGKPGGPNVRFIKAVLDEFKLPFERESIARAMTRFANARERRRVVRRERGS
jgi:hypothetical protein